MAIVFDGAVISQNPDEVARAQHKEAQGTPVTLVQDIAIGTTGKRTVVGGLVTSRRYHLRLDPLRGGPIYVNGLAPRDIPAEVRKQEETHGNLEVYAKQVEGEV